MPLRFPSNKINRFEAKKQETMKDMYSRLGDRVPQIRQSGGRADMNVTVIGQVRSGASMADEVTRMLAAEEAAAAAAAQETAPETTETSESTETAE